MKPGPALAGALLAFAPLASAETPPGPGGGVSVEVTSCEPFPGSDGMRVVLLRVRAGARGARRPEVRCGAAAKGGPVLAWVSVAGLGEVAAGAVREAMVLVPADAAHGECRCVASGDVAGAPPAPQPASER